MPRVRAAAGFRFDTYRGGGVAGERSEVRRDYARNDVR
jgi:hypothetical protein